jgi:hypothetical protein
MKMPNPDRTDELTSELIRRRLEDEREINKGIDRLVDAINASANEASGRDPDQSETDQKRHLPQRDA